LRRSIQRERSTKRKIVESGSSTAMAIMRRVAEDIFKLPVLPPSCLIIPPVLPNSKYSTSQVLGKFDFHRPITFVRA
jgi:hypothetical protein